MAARGVPRPTRTRRRWIALAVLAAGVLAGVRADEGRLELVWPTPNKAWAEGRSPAEWLQHAGSGDPASGGFGGVRSGGRQFHEGIDIRPVARDRRGEPLDAVFAAMAGVVRHVSTSPGDSGYGRYVVLEHPGVSPAVYTLYAHLAKIAPGLRVGASVPAGATLGTMGHSSGGYMIPVDRSHLHFEIGVAVTKDFQAWYERRKFGSRNEHGMWNGLNLLGIDPLAFYDEWRAGRVTTMLDFFQRMPTVVRVRIATFRTPDFVPRYPALLTKPMPLGPVAGWEVRFNWTGLPFAWTPLTVDDVVGMRPQQPQILEVNAEIEKRERSRSLAVVKRGGGWTAGKDLETVLQQLFGGR
jgi:murein DD-endopeptidase MepM/ murein hydrolase activator NlpD